MAEHRRVEPRMIAGSGLRTDPERVREVEEEYERKQRAWRDAPDKGFGDVLKEAPAKGALEGEDEAKEAQPKEAQPKEAQPKEAQPKEVLPKKGPRLPPDPRELLLRKQLVEGKLAPMPTTKQDPPKIAARSPSETPPTGSRPAKP